MQGRSHLQTLQHCVCTVQMHPQDCCTGFYSTSGVSEASSRPAAPDHADVDSISAKEPTAEAMQLPLSRKARSLSNGSMRAATPLPVRQYSQPQGGLSKLFTSSISCPSVCLSPLKSSIAFRDPLAACSTICATVIKACVLAVCLMQQTLRVPSSQLCQFRTCEQQVYSYYLQGIRATCHHWLRTTGQFLLPSGHQSNMPPLAKNNLC